MSGLAAQADLVPIEEAVEMVRQQTEVDRPQVAFTFDDGYIEFYQDLAPVLEDFGVNAALFLNSRYIDAAPDYIDRFNRDAIRSPGRLPMTAQMVADLADRGFVIGSHTSDHVRLDTDDLAVHRDQIVACKAEVEVLSNRACDWFAWPYGAFEHISASALKVASETYDVVFSSDGYPSYTSYDGRVINRRQIEAYWPISHARYFLSAPRVHEVDRQGV